MRLLVVSQYFWPENFRVNDLVLALERRGHEVTVLTGLPNYPDGELFAEFRAEPERFKRYGDVPVVRVPLLPRGRGSFRLALNYASFVLSGSTLGAWRLRGREFEAIFVYQPSPITACIPALVVGRLKRAPVLLWTLDLWPDTLEALGAVRSPAVLSLVGRLVSLIYRGCSLILGQSQGSAASIARYGGSVKKFRYFPQWSEPLFDGNLPDVKPAPEVRDFADTFNVLFAGNIGESQDFPAILHAAECLRGRADIKWLIVGDGRSAESVRAEVVKRGLTQSVHFLGRHPIARMPEFFRAAGALLVSLKKAPTFALTIPGKLQTYLASGLPVLGMLDGEGARVIEEAGAGLTCAAGDGAGLAARVEQLVAMPIVERAAMGRRGLEYSEREFGRERLLARLEGWLGEETADAS